MAEDVIEEAVPSHWDSIDFRDIYKINISGGRSEVKYILSGSSHSLGVHEAANKT